jgi:hypothetical protein
VGPEYIEDKDRFLVAEAPAGQYLAHGKVSYLNFLNDHRHQQPTLVPDYTRLEFVRDNTAR